MTHDYVSDSKDWVLERKKLSLSTHARKIFQTRSQKWALRAHAILRGTHAFSDARYNLQKKVQKCVEVLLP